MKKENTAARLKYLMKERNLRQVDILNLTLPYCKKYSIKMNKSDISQYVSGKNEPSQDKLVVLGMALGVNEAWLMGYDVPMEPVVSLEEWWKNGQLEIDKTNAFRLQLKALGWEYEFRGCDWWYEYHYLNFKIDTATGALSPDGKGDLVGCNGRKCTDCPETNYYYQFNSINGNTSFKVSCDDFDSMLEDLEIYLRKHLQELLLKSTQPIPCTVPAAKVIPLSRPILNAAHERTDLEVTDEMRKHDDDIMKNDKLWE